MVDESHAFSSQSKNPSSFPASTIFIAIQRQNFAAGSRAQIWLAGVPFRPIMLGLGPSLPVPAKPVSDTTPDLVATQQIFSATIPASTAAGGRVGASPGSHFAGAATLPNAPSSHQAPPLSSPLPQPSPRQSPHQDGLQLSDLADAACWHSLLLPPGSTCINDRLPLSTKHSETIIDRPSNSIESSLAPIPPLRFAVDNYPSGSIETTLATAIERAFLGFNIASDRSESHARSNSNWTIVCQSPPKRQPPPTNLSTAAASLAAAFRTQSPRLLTLPRVQTHPTRPP